MKVALFIRDNKIEDVNTNSIPIVTLNICEEVIISIEKEIILEKDINFLAFWLLTKRIDEIYVMDIDPLLKNMFEKLGIVVRTNEDKDVINNPFWEKYID